MNKISTITDYRERINRVLVYINNHLGDKIDLAGLSEIAHFSPFHFHRIMRAYLKESIGTYIIRIRMESAATLLLYTKDDVADIAIKVGYESPAAFSKAFQKRFGTSPSDYRQNKGSLEYDVLFISDLKSKVMELKPKIKEIGSKKVVYIHAIGDYNEVGPVWERLADFMKKKKLFGFSTESMGISYDDPDITEASKLRYDACCTVSKEVKPEGEVGYKVIEGGLFAIFRHKGPYNTLNTTYNQIYEQWLPGSGYELRDVPPREVYLNDPEKSKPEDLKTDIYIGVEPGS